MLPIVASALVGVVARIGVGLVASAAKHVWDATRAPGGRGEEFAALLAKPAARTRAGADGPRVLATAPSDLAARLAVERRQWSALADRSRSPEAP